MRSAIVELDGWDGPNFEAIASTLLRSFPAQAEFLFQGIASAEGPEAVLGVDTLLTRLDALETGNGRDTDRATREADRAALDLLAARGYTPAERERLSALVTIAKTLKPAPSIDASARQSAQLELYRWLQEWSAHARNAALGRSTLITLGLAERRKSADETPPPEPSAARNR